MPQDLKGAEKRRFETRQKLLNCARALFSKQGYHNTQVIDIVKEARVSAGTFYNYFVDKKDIFQQLTENNLEKIREETKRFRRLPRDIMKMPIEKRSELIEDVKYKIYNNIFKYMDSFPQQMIMTIRGVFGVNQNIDHKAMEFYNAMAKDFVEDMEAWEKLLGIEMGLNKLVLAHIILGSLFQVAHIYLTQKSFSREEAIATLIESIPPYFETLKKNSDEPGITNAAPPGTPN
jgi:AcrR family transcriptional regulator